MAVQIGTEGAIFFTENLNLNSTTLERARPKVKSNAIFRCGKDNSFHEICPSDTKIFCIALVSFSESSFVNLSCRTVKTAAVRQTKLAYINNQQRPKTGSEH